MTRGPVEGGGAVGLRGVDGGVGEEGADRGGVALFDGVGEGGRSVGGEGKGDREQQ